LTKNIGRDRIIDTIAKDHMGECWNEVLMGCLGEEHALTEFLEKHIGKGWNIYEYPCCSHLSDTKFVLGKMVQVVTLPQMFNTVIFARELLNVPETIKTEARNNKLRLTNPDVILLPEGCFFH
jgi:hypothetical protein